MRNEGRISYEVKQRDLQSGRVFRSRVQGVARAYEIYHQAVAIFLILVSGRLKAVRQTCMELVLSTLP